jgi:hypothetical protein
MNRGIARSRKQTVCLKFAIGQLHDDSSKSAPIAMRKRKSKRERDQELQNKR